jgi:tyrosyl-tRNA synthetase
MLNYFTFLSPSHIRDLMDSHSREPEKRKAHVKLAEQVAGANPTTCTFTTTTPALQ